VLEQVFESLPQAPTFQLYVQVLVSLKVPVSAPSVPQLKPVVGVQFCVNAGSAVVQLELSTVAPSERVQVAVRVAIDEPLSAMQAPVRDWARPVPQPVVGDQVE